MQDARTKLLLGMPIFGGIRSDVLQFLLGLCPVVSVPTNEYFFMSTTKLIRCSFSRRVKSRF